MKEYIERDALMKYPIRIDHYDKVNGNEHFVLGIESVLEYAEHIPAADVVERKRGEWVYEKTYQGMKYICSECGEIPECFEPNFCPNCGADMRGAEDA